MSKISNGRLDALKMGASMSALALAITMAGSAAAQTAAAQTA